MNAPRKHIIREQSETVTAELREKIKSKMDVGKFFAGFITLLLGILLSDSGPDLFLSKLGVIFLIASLGFCVAAVFCYDRLLMPREYWTVLQEDETIELRFQDRLRKEMVQSWSWLFVPAVFSFAIGFLLVASNALGFALEDPEPLSADWLIGLSVLGVLIPVALGAIKGPKIYD